jgi:hypothetical protein
MHARRLAEVAALGYPLRALSLEGGLAIDRKLAILKVKADQRPSMQWSNHTLRLIDIFTTVQVPQDCSLQKFNFHFLTITIAQ